MSITWFEDVTLLRAAAVFAAFSAISLLGYAVVYAYRTEDKSTFRYLRYVCTLNFLIVCWFTFTLAVRIYHDAIPSTKETAPDWVLALAPINYVVVYAALVFPVPLLLVRARKSRNAARLRRARAAATISGANELGEE